MYTCWGGIVEIVQISQKVWFWSLCSVCLRRGYCVVVLLEEVVVCAVVVVYGGDGVGVVVCAGES